MLEIELCDEGEDIPDVSKSGKTLKEGVRYEYLAEASQNEPDENQASSIETSIPLADLMSKLKNI